jgi:curved DNA-binding protein CbpA
MSTEQPFIDFYEVLQVSPNADPETIQRVFRHLAKQYHPDNGGDPERFDLLMQAYRTLNDPASRAAFDGKHQVHTTQRFQVQKEAEEKGTFANDADLRSKIMSLFYVQRRRDMAKPGIGDLDLERMVDCPLSHLEFHLWYLRQKGWIERTDSGAYAITVGGVDQVEESDVRVRPDRLLAEHNVRADSAEPNVKQISSKSRG